MVVSSSSKGKAVTQAPSSPNKHVLFLTKIAFILIILLLLPQLVESKNKRNKQRRKLNRFYSELRVSCAEQKEPCRSIKNLAENEMCITKCMNLECHESIFGDERGGELEPGELDEVREAEFEECVKKFIKKEGLMKKNR